MIDLREKGDLLKHQHALLFSVLVLFSTTALAYNTADPNLAREGAQRPQDPISATVELFSQVMKINQNYMNLFGSEQLLVNLSLQRF